MQSKISKAQYFCVTEINFHYFWKNKTNEYLFYLRNVCTIYEADHLMVMKKSDEVNKILSEIILDK